jgi:hypothetical protein
VPITRQKSPVFSIVSLPTDSVIVDHAVLLLMNFLLSVDFQQNIYLLANFKRSRKIFCFVQDGGLREKKN